MKPAFVLSLALIISNASAHCESDNIIFPEFLLLLTLVSSRYLSDPDHRLQVIEVGRSRAAENSPVKNYTSTEITCNINVSNATETVSVSAGSVIGFELGEGKRIYHPGPISMYLGKAPGKAAHWNGTGKSWFKASD